jgi:hypothetical protein
MISHSSNYPARQAGNDALRRMERASMDQTTHNAEYVSHIGAEIVAISPPGRRLQCRGRP